jgi:cytochrome c oxidase subunit 2
MGAVFSVFAGFYYWIEKISGLRYCEDTGLIHFFLFFAGVNITFFPMHFLGLAGMPRRIPSYPEAYSDWNAIATVGSCISVLSLVFFFIMVFKLFVEGKPRSKGERNRDFKLKNIQVIENGIGYNFSYYQKLYVHYINKKISIFIMRVFSNELTKNSVGKFIIFQNMVTSFNSTSITNLVKSLWSKMSDSLYDNLSFDSEEKGTGLATRHSWGLNYVVFKVIFDPFESDLSKSIHFLEYDTKLQKQFMIHNKKGNNDIPEAWQMTFQDAATPVMEGIIDLHHDIMFFIILISIFVFWMIILTTISFQFTNLDNYLHTDNKRWIRLPSTTTHNTQIEVIWTVIPSIILLFIALPSFALLYKMDAINVPDITLKAIGNQWYWTYEYVQTYDSNIIFDSYMSTNASLLDEFSDWGYNLKALDTTEYAALPVESQIRILITSTDVLHSWAVPSLGVKLDACPGRLNELSIFIKRIGYYYGQCSEICGVNHAFMPIVIAATSLENFAAWVQDWK